MLRRLCFAQCIIRVNKKRRLDNKGRPIGNIFFSLENISGTSHSEVIWKDTFDDKQDSPTQTPMQGICMAILWRHSGRCALFVYFQTVHQT